MAVRIKDVETLPCVCSQLRRTARLVSVFYDEALAPAGVTVTQYALLARIGRADGLSRTALAAQLGMDRTTLTRNLIPLEREAFILSRPGGDRREKLLYLTPAGRKRAAAARPLWLSAQRRMVQRLGLDHLGALQELLGATEGVLADE